MKRVDVKMIVFLLLIACPVALYGQEEFRYYDDGRFLGVSGLFEVVDVGRVVVYRQRGIYKTSKKEFYYFSKTLSSPIYPLKPKYLRQNLKDEELIEALLEIRRSNMKELDRELKELEST